MSPIAGPQKRALIEMGLRLIEIERDRMAKYRAINDQIEALDPSGLSARVPELVDPPIWDGITAMLNKLMAGASGVDCDLADFWANEARDQPAPVITWAAHDGKPGRAFPFKTVADVLAYIDARDADDADNGRAPA